MRLPVSTLQGAATWLAPRREQILADWVRAVAEARGMAESALSARCAGALDRLLTRLAAGEVDAFLREEAIWAEHEARRGTSLLGLAVETRLLDRCLGSLLPRVCPEPAALAGSLVGLEELGDRRLEILLAAQESESARRLIEAQEQAVQAAEQAKEVRRVNEALRRAEAEGRRRAEQLSLLSAVAHRLAPVREPEELMQQAADEVRSHMNHTYVAVVVLDEEGAAVGRWAGRTGVGRANAGRARGPLGGIIGRAIRTRAPQVVGDVVRDGDYHPDVPGTRSEMAIPLLEGGHVLGALDVQSEEPFAFGLDDVAAGETLADFIVVALRNAWLYQEACRRGGAVDA